MINLLLVSSEAIPFSKRGGLADVIGALARYTDLRLYDCRVVIPEYVCERKGGYDSESIGSFSVYYLGKEHRVEIKKSDYCGTVFYLLCCDEMFSEIYGGGSVETERFVFFQKAVIRSMYEIGFRPDIMHLNDWECGLIPLMMKQPNSECRELNESLRSFYADTRTVYTIHNLKYQGSGNNELMYRLTEPYTVNNIMRCGIENADIVTTVSESYRNEVLLPENGEGLDDVLREKGGDFYGITNGLDVLDYDPLTDESIAYNYLWNGGLSVKRKNKLYLQKKLGLDVGEDKFLIAMVARISEEKGLSLFDGAIEKLMNIADIQFVIVGGGDKKYEDFFNNAAALYPNRICAVMRFVEGELPRQVYAGADAYIMPSRFEPCGLSQLIAMRYGAVPIVRSTGGLRETVEQYSRSDQTGTGFKFDEYSSQAMLETVVRAETLFRTERDEWDELAKRCMKKDNSWKESIAKYDKLYKSLLS